MARRLGTTDTALNTVLFQKWKTPRVLVKPYGNTRGCWREFDKFQRGSSDKDFLSELHTGVLLSVYVDRKRLRPI